MTLVSEPTARIDPLAALPRHHAGSEWLAGALKRKDILPSPLGLRVADLLGEAAYGLYHITEAVFSPKTDWSNPHRIEVCYRPGYIDLCTVDGNGLTRLVFLAHDYGLRMEISPRTFNAVTLEFWQREVRMGGVSERCPTAEDALAAHRARYPMPEVLR